MTSLPNLETERVWMQPLTINHADAFHSMYSDPLTMRFMNHQANDDIGETRRAFFEMIGYPNSAYWVIVPKATEKIAGYIGYLGGTRVPGMGYLLERSLWGQGLVVEAATVALDYGFGRMGLDRVELWINEGNQQSHRVAEKLGFTIKGRLQQRYSWEEKEHIMRVYGLWAHEWPNTGATPSTRTTFYGSEPVLFCHDIAKTAEYYRDKLGFHVDFIYGDPPDHAGVSRGNWTGNMVSMQLSRVTEDREITPSGYTYLFVGANIDDLHQTYVKNGVDVTHPPQTYPWGLREFTIKDCNGHFLRFGTHASL